MIKVVVIPFDESKPMEVREIEGRLEEYQAVVGGWIEASSFERAPGAIFSNEEGLLQQLEYNHRATMLLYLAAPANIGYNVLVGDVVVVGPTDDEGETLSVADEILEVLSLK